MYHGDIRLGDTIDIKFTTVNTSGVPTTLAGTPVVSAYPGNSTTQLTAGITLTVDFDGVTGLHNVRVVATSGNGYATATNYTLVITTGTVGGSSVVGYCVGSFSIENRSALMPTVASRTFDVSSGGEGGLDWANIGSPTTTVALTGTTVDLVANAVDAAALATDAVTEIVNGVWNEDATGHQTQGTFGQAIGDPVADTDTIYSLVTSIQADTDDIQTRLPAALVGGRMDSSVGAVAANAITAAGIADGAIDAATFAAGALNAAALAQDAAQEIADEVLDRDLAGGASGGARNVRNALRALRNRTAIAAGTLTVYQENDTTAAWTAAVTTTASDPISQVDPA